MKMRMRIYQVAIIGVIIVFLGILFSIFSPSRALADKIKEVIVANFPEIQKVLVVNTEPISVDMTQKGQKWQYFYQCHPNPTNESEIRGFLNDRGAESWEVVAAAAPGGLICEYYKRPAE